MLPSPSLGPPLLSASPSPAPGPWGIPLELEVDALELDDFDLVAAEDELFVGVAVVVTAAGALLFACEEELPELPQPAAITPATASASKGNPRASLNLLIMVDLCLVREPCLAEPLPTRDDHLRPTNLPRPRLAEASHRRLVLGRVIPNSRSGLSGRHQLQGGPG